MASDDHASERMKNRILLKPLTLAIGAWVALACAVPPAFALDVLTTESPPFSYTNTQGVVVGLSADVVNELGHRSGVPMKIDNQIPWARAFSMAQQRPDTCAFSVARRPDREDMFKWVGPISINKWALFAREQFTGKIESLDDAKKYRIGGLRADAKTEYLVARGVEVEEVPNDATNASKLALGRIDLWVTGLYTAKEIAGTAGITGLRPVLVFHESPSYLACNRATPDATIARLEAALKALRKEGYLKKVYDLHAGHFSW
jgi:polar amino acid transport system substrate-binding protein